jgi:aspartyl-tRNA(Asn)/glutamyl-tRNA(Gln) amidotransferase subunit C
MISKEEIDNLATLARLELSDTEKESLGKDISNILEYVGQVSAVSLQGDALTPGLSQASPLTTHNVLREDTLREAEDTMAGKEEAVKQAFPKREGEYNVVRKIIQKDE